MTKNGARRTAGRITRPHACRWRALLLPALLLACSRGPEPASDLLDEQRDSPLIRETLEPWTGDFDGMVERRTIRALVVYSKTNYFLDGGVQRGLTYDLLQEFERFVNEELGTGHLEVRVVVIPVARDQLLPGVVQGHGDIAAANLTITEERQESVAFSIPFVDGVSEIVVTGPSAPPLQDLEELAGYEIWVRASSSYYESLERLNERFQEEGLAPVVLREADERLEDEDLLEMVNAGLLPMIVVDSHKARFWGQIFDHITVRTDLAVRTDREIAWAFRPSSPQLEAKINQFAQEHRRGTLVGNILFTRYLRNTDWVENPLAEEELEKFQRHLELFRKYALRYELDPLLLVAQAYQESELDQNARSSAGAIGVMQLLPSTAAAVDIPDIESLENNIHAGARYLRHVLDTYFDDPDLDPLNRTLLGFAAYNAGPTRIADLRERTAERGLDPDVWFDNVEVLAGEEIGQETVQYVSNIYKYYIAYRRIVEHQEEKEDAAEQLQSDL